MVKPVAKKTSNIITTTAATTTATAIPEPLHKLNDNVFVYNDNIEFLLQQHFFISQFFPDKHFECIYVSIGCAPPIRSRGSTSIIETSQMYNLQICPNFVRNLDGEKLIIMLDTFDQVFLNNISRSVRDDINYLIINNRLPLNAFINGCFDLFHEFSPEKYLICDYIEFANPSRDEHVFYIQKERIFNELSMNSRYGNCLYKWIGYKGDVSDLIVQYKYYNDIGMINIDKYIFPRSGVPILHYENGQPKVLSETSSRTNLIIEKIKSSVFSIVGETFPNINTIGGSRRKSRRYNKYKYKKRQTQKTHKFPHI